MSVPPNVSSFLESANTFQPELFRDTMVSSLPEAERERWSMERASTCSPIYHSCSEVLPSGRAEAFAETFIQAHVKKLLERNYAGAETRFREVRK
jgi:hypothetical protein